MVDEPRSTLHSFPPNQSNRHHLERNGTIFHLLIDIQRLGSPIRPIEIESIRPCLRTRTRHRPRRNFTSELVQAKRANLVIVPKRHRLLLRVAVRHARELRAGRSVVLKGTVGEEVKGRGSDGVIVCGVEEHVGIAGVLGVGVFVEVDAVVGAPAGVFGDEVEG